MHSGPAGIANDPHQPLRQNAIQRRDKVVRLDAHVQEAPEHVHHVIGVDGGEHEVARQRRLDGDLGGFVVANFAHHDLVRVMTQDGTQTAGEGQTLFFVDRNLGDAAYLILDRVFNGDDLVFVGLDLVDGGVEGRGFAAARRPGDQHHAVGFLDVAAKAAQVVVVEPDNVERELLELLAHRLLVEHAEHGVFAVDRGHDGNAEVDGAATVFHAEAAVLGHAALGNIEFAHDLNGRNDGGVVLLADGRHGAGEHAVDTKLDDHRVVPRLDVNIARPPLQRRKNRGVDQTDDRAHVRARRRRQLVDGDGLVVPGLVLADHVERESLARVFQHAFRLLGLLQNVGDLLQRRNFGDDPLAQQQADLVDHHQLAGIRNCNRQPPVRRLIQRNELIAEHQVYRDLLEQIVVQLEIGQVDELATVAPRDIPRTRQFVRNRRHFRHQ